MSIIESRNQYKKDRQEQKRIIIEKVLIPLGLTATMQGGAGKATTHQTIQLPLLICHIGFGLTEK